MKEIIFMMKVKDMVDDGLNNYKSFLDYHGKGKVLKMEDDEIKDKLVDFVDNKLSINPTNIMCSGAYQLTKLKLEFYNNHTIINNIKLHKFIKDKDNELKYYILWYKGRNNNEKIEFKKISLPFSIADRYYVCIVIGDYHE